jgi:hypothetical protein
MGMLLSLRMATSPTVMAPLETIIRTSRLMGWGFTPSFQLIRHFVNAGLDASLILFTARRA